MNNKIIQTIKNTLEETKSITVLSLNYEDNTLFGVYINNVRDSLSFLSLPKVHFETTISGINIQFFELGAVLHTIYFDGALKFIDILYPNEDLIEPSSHYIKLCTLVMNNIPFNIAKLKYIKAVNQKFTYENDVEKVLMLIKVMINFRLSLLLNDDFEDFSYVSVIENENDFIKACNQLQHFKNELEEKKFKKISEKNMNLIDEMYINLQILHLEV